MLFSGGRGPVAVCSGPGGTTLQLFDGVKVSTAVASLGKPSTAAWAKRVVFEFHFQLVKAAKSFRGVDMI